jgi:hypothetical protein
LAILFWNLDMADTVHHETQEPHINKLAEKETAPGSPASLPFRNDAEHELVPP